MRTELQQIYLQLIQDFERQKRLGDAAGIVATELSSKIQLTNSKGQLTMNSTTKELCKLLGLDARKIESTPDSDFVKSLKSSFTFGQTKDVKPKAQASAPFAPHYLGVGVPPLFGGGDVQKDNQPGLLDVFFEANRKWAKGE